MRPAPGLVVAIAATVLVGACAEPAPATRVLSAADALAIAFPDTSLDPATHARLTVFEHPRLPSPRLAWHVARSDDRSMSSLRATIDARTGAVLDRADLTRSATKHRARVFPVSPFESDDVPELVTLHDLPEDATSLADSEISVLNCIDRRSCQPLLTAAGVRDVHFCDLEATAHPSPAGDFLAIERPEDDTDPTDAFAEVQAYYHVKRALAAFRTWSGDPDFALANPLTVIVNMRVPNLATATSSCDGSTRAHPSSRLSPEDNAYFWPAGELGPTAIGDRVVMSQGLLTDWAYDGEVVYHEVTHAVMHTTSELGWMLLDERGLDPGPGGLHEGFSDYFAATMTGNPDLSWYAGTTYDGPAPMGSLLEHVRCGDVLTGEEHDESKAWASALWAIRRSLRSQAKRDMFDAALFRVLTRLGRYDGVVRAHDLVLEELAAGAETFIDDNQLNATEANALRDLVAAAADKFAERDLPACSGRTLAVSPGDTKDSLYLKGPLTWSSPVEPTQLLPATMQFELRLDAPTDAIKLELDVTYLLNDELGAPTEPGVELLVRKGRPIEWSWGVRRGDHDADASAYVTIHRTGDRAGTAVLDGPFAAGTYYLQLANRGADWGAEGIRFLVADDEGVFGDGKSDGDTAAPPGAGCNSGGTGHGSALVLLIGVLFAVRRRRR